MHFKIYKDLYNRVRDLWLAGCGLLGMYQMVVAEGGAILDVLCKRSIYSNRTVI